MRLKTKFGYKAITHWYYTLSVDFETQLFSTYETNTNNLVSAFFSPAKLNVGLGMDYKYTKGGCNLSVMVNPLNYSLYAVASDRVDPTRFNIKEGHKTENEFGSTSGSQHQLEDHSEMSPVGVPLHIYDRL